MISAKHNQSILDIAIQQSGSVFAAFNWCVANGISITDEITPGQALKEPTTTENNFDAVATFFKNNDTVIGTKYTPAPPVTESFGGFPHGAFAIGF